MKEQWLREELRASRTLMLNCLQWGVTVLVALETSLYFLRRDVKTHLVALGTLNPKDLFPFGRWLIGSLFLAIVAGTFAFLTTYVVQLHVKLFEQMKASE